MEQMIAIQLLWAAWLNGCARMIRQQADFYQELAEDLGYRR